MSSLNLEYFKHKKISTYNLSEQHQFYFIIFYYACIKKRIQIALEKRIQTFINIIKNILWSLIY